MNIEIFDSPPQPRANVKIERLEASPYPDGWRIKLNIDVTPFQERPSLEIFVRGQPTDGSAGRVVAELSVIETMHNKMEFTVHVRGVPSPVGAYVAEVQLYYDDRNNPQDQRTQPFEIAQVG